MSAKLKHFIPHLVDFFGMYCFPADLPWNFNMVSSTARSRVGVYFFWNFERIFSTKSLTLLILLSRLVEWLAWSTQKSSSKKSQSVTWKIGTSLPTRASNNLLTQVIWWSPCWKWWPETLWAQVYSVRYICVCDCLINFPTASSLLIFSDAYLLH